MAPIHGCETIPYYLILLFSFAISFSFLAKESSNILETIELIGVPDR